MLLAKSILLTLLLCLVGVAVIHLGFYACGVYNADHADAARFVLACVWGYFAGKIVSDWYLARR